MKFHPDELDGPTLASEIWLASNCRDQTGAREGSVLTLVPEDGVFEIDARTLLRRLASLLSLPAPGEGEAAKWLGELLAVIHRDGGQYQAMHGNERAVADAHAIVAGALSTPAAPELGVVKDGWQTMDSAPKDGTVIEAVGRYLDATAGFPRYVAFRDGAWYDCSRHIDQVICWAWRPRTDWPHEPSGSEKP